MRLVAMSLYSRTEKVVSSFEPFKNGVGKVFDNLIDSESHQNGIRLSHNAESNKHLVVVVASSKGLCGSFHETLSRFLQERSKNLKNVEFLTIGTKAQDIVSRLAGAPEKPEMLGTLTGNTVFELGQTIMERIYENNYKSATLFCNTFLSFFSYRPIEIQLYPLIENPEKNPKEQSIRSFIKRSSKPQKESTRTTSFEETFVLEQSREQIFYTIAQRYGEAMIESYLLKSLLAEYSARFVSMDGATKNAENALESLNTLQHKLRQAGITKEVSELSRSI